MPKKYRSKQTAIENARTFFSQTEADIVTVEEAWKAWGREITPEKEEGNKSWFSNKLTDLKYHNIVHPIYVTKHGKKGIRRILTRIELTLEGKKAIGRLEVNGGTPPPAQEVMFSEAVNKHARPEDHYDHTKPSMSIPEVMTVVANLREEHPEFDITFDIRLKEKKMDSADSVG